MQMKKATLARRLWIRLADHVNASFKGGLALAVYIFYDFHGRR